jgi:hypothetical protein
MRHAGRRGAAFLLALGAGALLTGCASPPPPAAPVAAQWQEVPLPGKARTRYTWQHTAGRAELEAVADGSASLLRRRVPAAERAHDEIVFAWRADALPVGGDVSQPDACDAAARVLLSFEGDRSRLSLRNQLQFELAHALTGELPPYATLVYVWDATAPVGSVIVHPRSDRVRKIVVESGVAALGQWRHYRRSLADDYRLAFGEAPGAVLAVAVMTDGDNTRSAVSARYRDIHLR